MSFLGGIPLVYYVSILVNDLDVSTFQLFPVGNIYFAYFYRSSAIFYQKGSII